MAITAALRRRRGHGARFIAGNKGKINYNVIQGELKAERDIFGDCKEADASGVAVGYVDALGPEDFFVAKGRKGCGSCSHKCSEHDNNREFHTKKQESYHISG